MGPFHEILFPVDFSAASQDSFDLGQGYNPAGRLEYEATQMYMQLAESIDNELAVEALKDIANAERVHACEFLRLLHELALAERRFYAEGANEVEDEIEKLKQRERVRLPAVDGPEHVH